MGSEGIALEEGRRQGADKGVLYKLVDASLAVAVNVSIFLVFFHIEILELVLPPQ